ncbi:hypothetical protein ACTXOJ_15225 [Glutamicibacter arilaitensis]|uniref:hypothetical protein n=1 Tax=Glutamicibacter arilaitensis TaxID=256701 RepID=UPI003FCF2BF8
MSRSAKRIFGNVSVFVVLVALVAVLVVSATSPTLLKNDAKLTAEANAGTPIVQAPRTPKPTPEASAYTSSAPKTMSEQSQDWADEKINQYLNGNGAHSFNAFPGSVHGDTLRWSSPADGELLITVKNGWPSSALDSYANLFLITVGHESPELTSVTVKTEDNSVIETETDKTPWE